MLCRETWHGAKESIRLFLKTANIRDSAWVVHGSKVSIPEVRALAPLLAQTLGT